MRDCSAEGRTHRGCVGLCDNDNSSAVGKIIVGVESRLVLEERGV